MMLLILLFTALVAPALCATTTRQPDTDNTTNGDAVVLGNATTADTITSSAPSVCNLSVYASEENDPIKTFKEIADDGAIFVYIKLDFIDGDFGDSFAAYLDDIGNIVDPLTWVWAKGGRGKLLLASPFDFNYLSLTTLNPGVYTLDLTVEGSTGCFGTNRTDNEKLLAIAVFLQDVLKAGDEDGNGSNEDGIAEDELICLEKQLGKKDIPLSGLFNLPGGSYSTMQLSTAFDCWSNGEPDKSKRVYKESWLNWILAGGFILAMFSPIAMSFFIQKNPPETDEQGVERLSLVSDLPLGLKYVTCFWAKNNICVSTTRWTLFILLFMGIQYVPILISFLTDMDGFTKRMSALNNTGPQNGFLSFVWHTLINVIFLMAAIVLMERFFRDEGQKFLEPLLRERARTTDGDDEASRSPSYSDDGATPVVEDESNDIYKHMVMIEAPAELWAPSTSLEDSQAFFYYMRWRARMGVDIKAWRFVIYKWLWGMIAEHVGAPPDNPRTILCAVIFTFAFPFYLPFALIFFAFNTLPLLYCMTRCLQTLIGNKVEWSEIMFSLLIVVASIAWFFKFVATFVYIAELLGYSFMGFVVNADVVGPTVLVVVIIAGYIVSAITRFYDGYCVLFSEVMGIAEAVDGAVESKRAEGGPEQVVSRRRGAAACRRMVRQARGSSAEGHASIEMQAMDGQGDNGAAAPPPVEAADTPLVSFNAKAIPTLELKLFWLIVEKYRPIRVQVASTFFQLLVIILAIGFGMSILAIADSLSNLSTTVELFASVIIAGVVPTVLLALKSPASQDCYDQAKKRQIKADVFHFAKTGKLKSTAH